MSRRLILYGVIALAVIVVLANTLFVVEQREQAIVVSFGDPVRVIHAPGQPGAGLNFKTPFVENVIKLDRRNLALEADQEEVIAADQERLVVDAFLRYRIADPLQYYRALHDERTAQDRPASPEQYFSRGVHVEKSYLIHRHAAELYHFWRDFSNLPQFMTHLISVEPLSDTRSRWTAKAPFGRKVSWEAEIIHDSPNELISWKSVENSAVANVGTVLFIPHGGGGDGRAEGLTEVRVVLDYIPPAGTLGKIIAELFGEEPAQTVQEGLRRFKRMAEAGSLAHAK